MKTNKNYLRYLQLAVLFIVTPSVMAQSTDAVMDSYAVVAVLGFVLFVAFTLLMAALVVLNVLRRMVNDQRSTDVQETIKLKKKRLGFWQLLDRKFLTQAVAIEEEKDIILDHDYDGIKELDNHLPPWWKYLFYFSIVFAFAYLMVYHVWGSLPLQTQEYKAEMALADAQRKAAISDQGGEMIDESNVTFNEDPTVLASGKQVFIANCAPCHKAQGQGGIGPNLTDEYWINGGGISAIFKAVKYGFPDKGMIAWEALLSPNQMSDVASFVMSIKGTNPPDAKAPQGELYVEENESNAKGEEDEVQAPDSVNVE